MIQSKNRRIRKHKRSKRTNIFFNNNRIIFGGSNDTQLMKDTCIYIIYGLGCSIFNPDTIADIKKYYHNLTNNKIPIDDIYFTCHHKHLAPIRGIFCSVRNEKPMNNSTFLTKLCYDIQEKCREYNKVFIFGFSYGGLISNRIAEELNDIKDDIRSRIFISTFGSIYISPPDSVKNINIMNYLSIGDVSESVIISL